MQSTDLPGHQAKNLLFGFPFSLLKINTHAASQGAREVSLAICVLQWLLLQCQRVSLQSKEMIGVEENIVRDLTNARNYDIKPIISSHKPQ